MKRSLTLLAAAIGIAACSSGSDETAIPAETDAPATSPESRQSAESSTDDGSVTPAPTDAADVTEPQPETTPPIVDVPETGVPGLDSDDAFCAAWSRFGGSWQVLAVGSSFIDDSSIVAEWEVVAAPVIATAYDDLLDNLPAELATEAGLLADGYFGVLARRSAAAGQALAATGASADLVDTIGEAWVAALAVRDPFSPELALELTDEAADVVTTAGETFAAQRIEFHLDPSMIVAVETPLTDAYLEVACPDQGTLGGQEVDGG